MRQLLSLVLVSTMLARLASGAPDTDSVKAQIASMSSGTKIELRLKNNEKMRGTRGPVSGSGFTLVDGHNGERQIAFDDVVSVKQVPHQMQCADRSGHWCYRGSGCVRRLNTKRLLQLRATAVALSET